MSVSGAPSTSRGKARRSVAETGATMALAAFAAASRADTAVAPLMRAWAADENWREGESGGRRTRHQMSLTRTVFRSDAGLLRNAVLPREAILFCGVVSFCKPVPALVFFHGLKISDTTSAARDNARKRRWIAGPPKRLGVHRAVHALQRVGHIDDARRVPRWEW